MEALVAYLISIGLMVVGFGIVVVAAKTAIGSLLVWAILGLVPILVGSISLLGEVRNGRT